MSSYPNHSTHEDACRSLGWTIFALSYIHSEGLVGRERRYYPKCDVRSEEGWRWLWDEIQNNI